MKIFKKSILVSNVILYGLVTPYSNLVHTDGWLRTLESPRIRWNFKFVVLYLELFTYYLFSLTCYLLLFTHYWLLLFLLLVSETFHLMWYVIIASTLMNERLPFTLVLDFSVSV